MYALRSFQTDFADYVTRQDKSILFDKVCAAGIEPQRRLNIYHNNVYSSFTEALKAVYPVIAKLIGDDFFKQTARSYIACQPSTNGDLHHFGDQFADFLLDVNGLGSLPYLKDVARLEWAYHESFHAADHVRLDVNRLQCIEPAQYGNIVFKLHPTLRLLLSELEILSIWKFATEEDPQGEIQLQQRRQRLAISRCQFEVEIRTLNHLEYTFLDCVRQQNSLGEIEKILSTEIQSDPPSSSGSQSFNLQQCLVDNVMNGHIVEFALQ